MSLHDQLAERLNVIAALADDANAETVMGLTLETVRESMRQTPAPWADDDPDAAQRYLTSRSASPTDAAERAEWFELEMRALYGCRVGKPATAFEDIARFIDYAVGA